MSDNFKLAHFGHVAQVGAMRVAQKLLRIDFRHIEWWKLISRFAGRGALEDQPFILAGMLAHLLELCAVHRATSAAAASMAARVVSSVQHHRAALPSSG